VNPTSDTHNLLPLGPPRVSDLHGKQFPGPPLRRWEFAVRDGNLTVGYRRKKSADAFAGTSMLYLSRGSGLRSPIVCHLEMCAAKAALRQRGWSSASVVGSYLHVLLMVAQDGPASSRKHFNRDGHCTSRRIPSKVRSCLCPVTDQISL